jgi:hypothetical protein
MKRTGLIVGALGIILFAQAAQAGWTSAKRLTWTSGSSTDMDILADSTGGLHLVWSDSTPGNLEIYYKRSTNGGANWSANQRLTWTSGTSRMPAIAADWSGGLHVAWYDDTPGNAEIYYRSSPDGGSNWTTTHRLSWTSGSSYWLAITVDFSGYIHVLWADPTPGNTELYHRRSTDGGATWTGKRLTWTAGLSTGPKTAVDSWGGLNVVWYDMTTGSAEIYYRKSLDDGLTWTAVDRLTWSSDESWFPDIAGDSFGNLHLVWEDETPGNWEVYYKNSTNSGSTWSTSRRLTWTSGTSWWPAVAAGPTGSLHLIWHDDTPGGIDIFYMASPDKGATWTSPQRLTWTFSAGYPALAVDPSGNVHVVYNIGNTDIYYKKGT